MQSLISALAALTLSLTAFAATLPKETEINVPQIQQINQVEQAEDSRVTSLNECENGGKWDEKKVLDTDKFYSYGGLQYHLNTFRTFGEKYNVIPKGLTDDEIKKIIYDKKLQVDIATHMLNDGLWYHWKNCSVKAGIDKL